MRHDLKKEYFEWLCEVACEERRLNPYISFIKLLTHLHDTEFTYLIRRDGNRAKDGMDLRYRFAVDCYPDDVDSVLDILGGPCSILEMMVALAIRCEETITDDPAYGGRQGQIFWSMIVSLGLGSMLDTRYDEIYVNDVITTFLNRDYQPNGKGGLFTINNCDVDLRGAEIWHQMCWYLDDVWY